MLQDYIPVRNLSIVMDNDSTGTKEYKALRDKFAFKNRSRFLLR